MTVINKFLAKRFGLSVLFVLCVVCGIIYALSFMQVVGNAPDLASAMDSSFSDLLDQLPMFLPLTAFLGTLLVFYRLITSSELVVIQSAGLSIYKIMRPMLVMSSIIGLVTMTIVNPISTRYSSSKLDKNNVNIIDNAIWIRENTNTGNIIIRSTNMTNIGINSIDFANGTIIKQNEKHQIVERTVAKDLLLKDGVLFAKNALILNSEGKERIADWKEKTSLLPENIVRQFLKPNQVSFWELPSFMKTLSKMGVPTQTHELQFLSLLFLPLVLVAMTVLGVMFAQTKERRNFVFVKKFGFGILTCFVVYFMIQVFNAMGASGSLPPLLAVFLPPAIVLFFSATIINRMDNI